jgi:hypothetical protein
MIKRNDEQLWNIIKNETLSANIAGTKSNQWSARKAQLSVKLYKDFGGTYSGKKNENNSLIKWTKQNWRTKSGIPSNISKERYLPYEAIKKLSPSQYKQTSLKKLADTKLGIQYSKQPLSIANITKKYRK